LKQTLLAALFAAVLAVAPAAMAQQEHGAAESAQAGAAHGGEGGTTAQPHGSTAGEGSGAQHAEAATQHGEGHAEEEMPNENLWKWANFALLFAGLGYLISKYAPAFFRSRTREIQKGIAEATRTRQEAEARAAEIERKVGNLQAEVAAMRVQSREEIVREGERIRQETEAQLRKIQAQTQAEIASATKHATHDLKAYSAKLALELAEGQIRGQMTPSTQDGLTRAFVQELRQKAGNN
jgi:F-type H+-transporting ATPase subunit b